MQQQEGARVIQSEVFGCASLREWKSIKEDSRSTSIARLYASLDQTLSLSLKFDFYQSKHQVSSTGLALAHASDDITLPFTPSPQKLQAHHEKVWVHFSLWSPEKCVSTKQCKVGQNMSVLSKESFISITCPFACLL